MWIGNGIEECIVCANGARSVTLRNPFIVHYPSLLQGQMVDSAFSWYLLPIYLCQVVP